MALMSEIPMTAMISESTAIALSASDREIMQTATVMPEALKGTGLLERSGSGSSFASNSYPDVIPFPHAVAIETGGPGCVDLNLADDVTRLRKSLIERLSGTVFGLDVTVQGDHVILTGRAPTYYAKQKCSHAALEAAQDRRVLNEIVVH